MERCHRQCSAELFQRRSRLVRLDSSIAFLRVAFGSLLVPSADPFMSVQGAILYQGDDESYYTLLYTYGAMDFFYIYQHIPELVRIVIWEASILQDCMNRNLSNFPETESEWAQGSWQKGTKGCIQKPGFEDGTPIWKSFAMHFWATPESVLGGGWNLSPEDYGKWLPGLGNHYLGKRPVSTMTCQSCIR